MLKYSFTDVTRMFNEFKSDPHILTMLNNGFSNIDIIEYIKDVSIATCTSYIQRCKYVCSCVSEILDYVKDKNIDFDAADFFHRLSSNLFFPFGNQPLYTTADFEVGALFWKAYQLDFLSESVFVYLYTTYSDKSTFYFAPATLSKSSTDTCCIWYDMLDKDISFESKLKIIETAVLVSESTQGGVDIKPEIKGRIKTALLNTHAVNPVFLQILSSVLLKEPIPDLTNTEYVNIEATFKLLDISGRQNQIPFLLQAYRDKTVAHAIPDFY